jgi:sec-independent protein translocase protein TatA
MGNLGAMELLLIAGIAMLVFGAGRVSDIGKGLGQGIRNFKAGMREAGHEEAKTAAAVPPAEAAPVAEGGNTTSIAT